MRHRNAINHLGRKNAHREAMLANMACSLIKHKRINTTLAKAKVLRTYIEPLITKAKNDSTHSRRTVFSYLQDKYAVTELFREISVKVAERPGGYTRILKTGFRLGDNAEMCMIELVDYNENLLAAKDSKAAKKTARRRSTKKTTEAPVQAEAKEAKPKKAKEPKPVVEEPQPEEVKDEAVEQPSEEQASEEKAE